MIHNAIHEAAHAVLNIIYGIEVDRVTIDDCNHMCYVAKTKLDEYPVSDLMPDKVKHAIYCLFAGEIAEAKLKNIEIGIEDLPISDDVTIAYNLHFEYNKDKDRKTIDVEMNKLFYESILIVNKHWNKIKLVAHELQMKKTLTGNEVKSLIYNI